MKFAANSTRKPAGPPLRRGPERRFGAWRAGPRIGGGTYFELLSARPEGAAHPRYDFALKIPRAEYRTSQTIRDLLVQEAEALQSLQSPHILPLVDEGETADGYFLVMPIVAGLNLAELRQSGGRLPLPTAVWIARQTAQALETVHAGGWLHGDLKPENILVSPTGHATLIDFGLAHPIRHASSGPCYRLAPRGTLRYMAPERLVAGYPLGPAADLYSLGATLFEMLLGLPLRGESTPEEIVRGHLSQSLPPRVFLGLASNLAELLRQMLAKDPIRRPESAGMVVRALARIETELLVRAVA